MDAFVLPDVPTVDTGGCEARQGPNFVVLAASGALAQSACMAPKVAHAALFEAAERMRRHTGLDPQMLVVLTSAPLACGDLFYLPFANDVRGIGYQHQDPRELFDDSPDSRLEGIAFLNDFPYWQAHPEEFAKAFAHEVGHRWSARVHAMRESEASPLLLGRQAMHWSYFLDTGGSPIEGNAWVSVDAGSFRADTLISLRSFSDFDLYLMGVLPAAEVEPERLIVPSSAGTDCLGHTLAASSPPQTCGALEVPGRAEAITIEAVIDAEGARVPAPDVSPQVLDVAVLVLESDGSGLDPTTCQTLTSTLRERLADFEAATLGRIVLRNLGESSAGCEDLAQAAPTPWAGTSGGCRLPPREDRADSMCLPGCLLLAMLAYRRRARKGR